MSKYVPFAELVTPHLKRTSKHHKKVTIVGVRASSKTTALGCLSLTCDVKSLKEKNFVAFIDEKTSGILQVPSELCQGYFPPSTLAGSAYEADLIMKWKTTFGEKTVVLPFYETAGEDMENLIGPYAQNVYAANPEYAENLSLNKIIGESDGYVLVVPVNRALMFRGKGLEAEPENLLPDPDVNLRRILASIFRYKRRYGGKIDGIAVLLTKCDWIDAFAKGMGMNLFDPEAARKFMHTFFRQTSTALKYYGMEKVRFFPVFVHVEKQKVNGQTKFVMHEDESRGYKIALADEHPELWDGQDNVPVLNLPVYSQQSYLQFIDWIKDTFAN